MPAQHNFETSFARKNPSALEVTEEVFEGPLSRAIDQRIFEGAPWIFLWFPLDVWARHPRVEGWRIPAIFNGQRWSEARILP